MDLEFAAHTLAALPDLPTDRRVALMVRHSLRDAITGMENVYTASLTSEGWNLARTFGQELALQRPLGRIMASPVSRCVDTAVAIAEGAGLASLVRVDDRLSHFLMAPIWDMLPEIAKSCPPPPQIITLLDLLLDHAPQDGALDLFVTHDTVVGALAGYFTGLPIEGLAWPQYLEGIFLWQDGKKIYARWRGIFVELPAYDNCHSFPSGVL